MDKISKASVLYMYIPGVKHYTCEECVFFNGINFCSVFSVQVKAIGSCGHYLFGTYKTSLEWGRLTNKKDAGYVENPSGFGYSCKRCKYYSNFDCEKVDKNSEGATPGIIHPDACCNAWEFDSKRATMSDEELFHIL